MGALAVIAARISSDPQHARQRLTRTLSGRLPFLAREQTSLRIPQIIAPVPLSPRCDRVQNLAGTPLELCERPAMQALLAAYALRRSLAGWLSDIAVDAAATLEPIPERICDTPGMRAAGFSDRGSRSVHVDIAAWQAPSASVLEEHAWQRTFAWLVASDRDLNDVVADAALERLDDTISGGYRYVADGVACRGILTISVLPSGTWRIIDCWGDADALPRIQNLASTLIAS